ncbi:MULTISPECIES: hypothetical protein [unclassified Streptomyces]|uniref:hypothetical protein n=1 Tax=unclassified Streptomyces TaxID=2593676 RepID=UPI00341D91E4
MADRRAPWWLWAYMAASFLSGVNAIVASLLDRDPWWSWLPHLLVGLVLVFFAVFLFVAVGRSPQRGLKKRGLPPL